jgi:hypothetical protein
MKGQIKTVKMHSCKVRENGVHSDGRKTSNYLKETTISIKLFNLFNVTAYAILMRCFSVDLW